MLGKEATFIRLSSIFAVREFVYPYISFVMYMSVWVEGEDWKENPKKREIDRMGR